jgi:hypothetical protein
MRQFLWPVAAVLFWEIVLTSHSDSRNQWGYHSGDVRTELILSMIFLPLDAIALGWSGMWFGMKSKSRIRAMLLSLCLIIVAPALLTSITANLSYTHSGHERTVLETFFLVGFGAIADLLAIALTLPPLLIEFRRMALATETR